MRRTLALILLLALMPFAVSAADTGRTLQASAATEGVNRITFVAGVGQFKLSASPDDKVHVQVRLERKSQNFLWFFHWMSDTTAHAFEQVTLQQHQQADGITYSLQYPDHLDEGDVKQNWDIQVPARLAVKVQMKVGQLALTGVTGGVEVDLNVGEVTLNTPAGPMHARVNVGQIRATSATIQPGDIRLKTTIGDARLYMKDRVDHDNMHHDGLGRTISVTGKGADQMDLAVNIGEVTLHVGPAQTGDAGH